MKQTIAFESRRRFFFAIIPNLIFMVQPAVVVWFASLNCFRRFYRMLLGVESLCGSVLNHLKNQQTAIEVRILERNLNPSWRIERLIAPGKRSGAECNPVIKCEIRFCFGAVFGAKQTKNCDKTIEEIFHKEIKQKNPPQNCNGFNI